MKKIVFLLLYITFASGSYSQSKKNHDADSSFRCLRDLSYFWQLDSLGQNGFRLYTYKTLLSCDLDKLSVTILFEKLGKPNFVEKTTEGALYCYYFYDGRYIPKNAGLVPEVGYISFAFNTEKDCLIRVGYGHFD